MQHRFHYAVDVLEYVMIPEANDPKTKPFECSRSRFIFGNSLGVLPAIQFDDQPRLKRSEVSHIPTDRDLPPEFISVEPTPAQVLPKQLLCLGFVPAKFSRHTQAEPPHPALSPMGRG